MAFMLSTPAQTLACSVGNSLDFLFSQCRAPDRGISDEDYAAAAKVLGADVAAVRAVAEVETASEPFDSSGRPTILFERHYFYRLTHGRFSGPHYSDISNPVPGGYGPKSGQYPKLERAYRLDQEAALQSASWGRFQIMGANFQTAGHANVGSFVLAMASSELAHLSAFVQFVSRNSSALQALQGEDWAKFAASYNGPNYKANQYDTKMAEAYARHKRGQP
jgi:hypothetical protein